MRVRLHLFPIVENSSLQVRDLNLIKKNWGNTTEDSCDINEQGAITLLNDFINHKIASMRNMLFFERRINLGEGSCIFFEN